MAFVIQLEKDDREFRSLHPTKVICKYVINERDSRKILQLNTYGSDHREVPGKLSQTIQFDEEAARQLYMLLTREFGFK